MEKSRLRQLAGLKESADPSILEALEAAYTFISQPQKSTREGRSSVWISTYRQSSQDYNRLTANLREAIQKLRSPQV